MGHGASSHSVRDQSQGMLDDWSMEQGGFKKQLYLKLAGRRLLEGAYVHCTADAELARLANGFLGVRGESSQSDRSGALADLPGPDEAQSIRFSMRTCSAVSESDPCQGIEGI